MYLFRCINNGNNKQKTKNNRIKLVAERGGGDPFVSVRRPGDSEAQSVGKTQWNNKKHYRKFIF